ncbi:hypothetical protein DFP72DRAFT_922616 [Ephemerocybe angulata]|uniref:Uncharacterized protein n=1 Tax=Ephemerocybe angulata TaxID=980116 RepID=A0A8H6HGG7_9AGAR|nr:hypothetical protein DFP72DRAFT_922616 [Tulosesus angulatus]
MRCIIPTTVLSLLLLLSAGATAMPSGYTVESRDCTQRRGITGEIGMSQIRLYTTQKLKFRLDFRRCWPASSPRCQSLPILNTTCLRGMFIPECSCTGLS